MRNQRGAISVALLLGIFLVGTLIALYPNPIRTGFGLEQKPNTIVQKTSHDEKLVPVMVNGQEVGFKTVTNETCNVSDQAPKGWINDLLALPRLWILLMVLGCFCPAVAAFMANLNGKIKTAAQTAYNDLTGNTKQIVVGVKRGLDTLPTSAVVLPANSVVTLNGQAVVVTPVNYKQGFLDALSVSQDTETEDLVKELLKGQ